MRSALSAPHFHSEEAAHQYVEARLWPEGPVCPRCGQTERVGKLSGKSTRVGVHKCYQCRKPFTVKIGTIFEDSKVPLNIWLQAIYLVAGSKKGISSNQLHRTLGVTLKTAWFMSHRIREAMRSDGELFGGGRNIVEADETYIGFREGAERGNFGLKNKMKVLALIDRATGRSAAFVVDQVNASTILPILRDYIHEETILLTDEHGCYKYANRLFYAHGATNHQQGYYGRGALHSNNVEGYFSIFKRGMRGIYQWCAEKHLHRYVAEFNFRYCNREANGFNDLARADELLKGVVGRRLTYQRAHA